MKKLNRFLKEVEAVGSVFDYTEPLSLSDWDSIFKRFAKMGIKGEIVYYCSPRLVEETIQMLRDINAGVEREEYGEFNENDNSWGFLLEATFMRGSYTICLVEKDMKGGVLMPTLPEEDWGTGKLAVSSIRIETNE
ncbi:MAG: hypothetical protein WBA57_23675 [Elainellaceae cyanobacterium]